MKKIPTILLFVLFISSIVHSEITTDVDFDRISNEIECPNEKDGFIKEYYKNGKLKTEYFCVDEKVEGSLKEYYENGKIKQFFTLVHGIQNGLNKEYYENGNIKYNCNYKNGKYHGICKFYKEAGGIEKELFFKEDVLDAHVLYYENGNIAQISVHKSLNKEGINKYFSGKIFPSSYDVHNYYEDGTLKETNSYKANLKAGSVRHGVFLKFYENGVMKEMMEYENDKLINKRKYDNEGNLISKGTKK